MRFWTDLKKSGQEAAGKAKDLAEVTKLQLAQKEQERKLEQLYAQLGKSLYEKAVQEENAEFSDLLQSITQTLEEIETCKEQQLLIKGGVRCAACGTLMEADAMFCPNCGAQKELPKEPEVVVEAAPGKMICPGCGKQVDPKAFCAFCGTKLS